MKKFGLTLLTAFVGGAMALGSYKLIENKYASNMSFEDKQKVYFTSNHLSHSAANVSSSGLPDFVQAAAEVTPAVVYIRTTYSNQGADNQQSELQQMFGQMFGQRMPQQQVEMASGSGVIISPDGYIVTNNHVVDKAVKIEVVTNDHRDFKAKVIGTDPNTDLALIKIEGSDLPIVKLGNSDNVKVGEWVLAVGNPFKLTSTVTAGIVSAKGRNINIIGNEDNQDENSPFGRTQYQQQQPKLNQAIESFIQTDAAINPGNSGGALVNASGELIGINSAIASHTGSYEGYGFAIPINLAKKVLDDIEKYGKVKRGYVGISFKALDEDVAADLHIDRTAGLYVDQVIAGGGADAAGIKPGDIITKVDGNKAYESSDLQETVGRLEPGDKVHLTVVRGGEEKNFTVTLHANNPQPEALAANPASATELYNKIGATFMPLSNAQKAKFHVNAGVVVTQVRNGGLFDYTDVPEGSVITNINKQPISSVADIDRALSNLQHGVLTISGLYPDGTRLRSTIEIQ